MKKKSLFIGMLLFFILTLPVSIYYGSQKYTQITEGRSRAGIQCYKRSPVPSGCAMALYRIVDGICEPERCFQTSITTLTPTPQQICNVAFIRDNGCKTTGTCTGKREQIWKTVQCTNAVRCIYDATCPGAGTTPVTDRCNQWSSQGNCATINCSTYINNSSTCNSHSPCCYWGQNTPVPTRITTNTPTPGLGITIIERGCINGRLITVGQCVICSHGGIMTCDGPSGGSGGDPCQVKYSDGSVVSTNCTEANMIRCHCGGNAWVGGRPGVTCAQLCACAGINCDTCTPTPQNTNPPQPTDVPHSTNTPASTNTPNPTLISTLTPTITNTSAPGTCDASCDSDSNCQSGLVCVLTTGVKRCRKSDCPNESSCSCPIATPTERVIYVQQPTVVRIIAEAPITTETLRPTPKIPVSGFFDVKAIIITIGSILLLTLGLIL